MNKQERIRALMGELQRAATDCAERRDEYAQTIAARWGEALGLHMTLQAAMVGTMGKMIATLHQTGVPPSIIQAMLNESARTQRAMFQLALKQHLGDRETDKSMVESIFDRMADNDLEVATKMAEYSERIGKIMNEKE